MPEPERSIEELVEEVAADVRVAQRRQEKYALVNAVSLDDLLRAVARLREERDYLDAENRRLCMSATFEGPDACLRIMNRVIAARPALTPKGGDRE